MTRVEAATRPGGAPLDGIEHALPRLVAEFPVVVLFDGRGPYGDGWRDGSRAGVADQVIALPDRADAALAKLDALAARRCGAGGARSTTGLAVLVAYDGLERSGGAEGPDGAPPRLAVEIDASVGFVDLDARVEAATAGRALAARAETLLRSSTAAACDPCRLHGRPSATLDRESYRRAIARVLRHVADGDCYQANLCRAIHGRTSGDPTAFYLELARRSPAPRSAFLRAPGFALASVSPELFLAGRFEGPVETRPIKGTRPRDPDPLRDAQRASDLLNSAKDRAELTMIVDLERNDLGRIAETGSVAVAQLGELRSYAHVHHLVARVTGRLRRGVGLAELLRATFPGGSITGAPKRRAREIVAALEGESRGLFTGCLLWLGDDGSFDSSLLIRSVVLSDGQFRLGAGSGVVADSDPDGEWSEVLDKARPLCRALGFEPEEAS